MKKLNFCDGWVCGGKAVVLPHDAMLEAGRASDSPGGSAVGYFKPGTVRYEKRFARPEAEHAELLFEGVYAAAEVFVNDSLAGKNDYGYGEFVIDMTPFLCEGENIVAVEADNSRMPNSRWYTGTGIYRPVWLLTGGKEHFPPYGLSVETVSVTPPTVRVETQETGGDVTVEVLDGERVLYHGKPGTIVLERADLWDENSPKLYTCRASLEKDGGMTDVIEDSFGIRMLSWDSKGLYMNGRSLKLRGGCVHHDNGILGACSVREAEWRKVRMLKEAGFNAIRCAHNPCSPALLDACDHYGIFVMDETWDMWYSRKNKYDYGECFAEHWKDDLRTIVNRDRNHPGVIMYSIGNEVTEPVEEEGLTLAGEMTALLHSLDGTRPVTGGFNPMLMFMRKKSGMQQYAEEAAKAEPVNSSLLFNMMTSVVGSGMNRSAASAGVDKIVLPLMDQVDIMGYNYASSRYAGDAKKKPGKLLIGTETFPHHIAENWPLVEKYDHVLGDFMWTAWDYLGEAGIGAWAYSKDGQSFTKPYPWLLADTGAMDILGDPNAELYMAQAAWGQLKEAPRLTVTPLNHPGVRPAKQSWRGSNAIPSWSWQDCEGNRGRVEVYSDASKVQLSLNGKKLGKKKVKDGRAVFSVKYEPGTLEAAAYDRNGALCGKTSLCSAGNNVIRLNAEPAEFAGAKVRFIRVLLADEAGNTEANADRKLSVTVENGMLLGFGSADPRTEESFLAGEYSTYYGRALAAVRIGEEGMTTVTVSDGKDTVSISIVH